MPGQRLSIAYGAAMLLATGLVYALVAVDLCVDPLYRRDGALAGSPFIVVLLFLPALAGILLYGLKARSMWPGLVKKALDPGLTLAALFLAIALAARPLLDYEALLYYQVTPHFNAYAYAITQTCAGRALLVDFDGQYGLYAQLLEPVFAVIGLSLFSFLAVMAVLLAISFLCFYFVLHECVRDPVIRFLGTAAVLSFGYVLFELGGDPYFQYFPHRIIFPGLLLALAYLNFTRRSRVLYYLAFFVCSVSVLWNVETGVIVFITWALALLYQDLLRNSGRSAALAVLKDLSIGAISLGATFAAYVLYVYLRYGSLPRLLDLVSYQYYFYGAGFFMVPMPPVGAWNLVALVYAAGIVYAARALLDRDDSVRAKMIFTLSILGAGIFSYYQGRSLPDALATVLYPALLLAVIFTDMLYGRVLKGIRVKKVVAGEALILLGLLFFLVAGSFALAENRALFPAAAPGPQAYIPGMIERNIAFINEHTRPGEKVLILCHYSSAYYMGTHTASPLGIPGFNEIINRTDMDRIAAFLRSGDPAGRKVFVDTFFSNELTDNAAVLQPLMDDYRIAGISDDGNLLLYERSGNGTPPPKPMLDTCEASGADGTLHYAYDGEKHAFLTPDGRFGAYENGCSSPVLLNRSYTIEVTLRPGGRQAPYADILYEMLLWYGGHGFILQKDVAGPDAYSYSYGTGQGIVKALRFNLSDRHPSYLAITDDGLSLRAYVNGTLASSYVETLPLDNYPTPLYIGNYPGLDQRFNGTVYDMAISNRSLSAPEIAAKSRAMAPGAA